MAVFFWCTAGAITAAVLTAGGKRLDRRGRLAQIGSGMAAHQGLPGGRAWALPDRLDRLAPMARSLGASEPGQRLEWSGVGIGPEQYLALRLVALLGGALAGVAAGIALGGALAPLAATLAGALVGWEGPELWLAHLVGLRRGAIDRELLYFVDYLALTAEAGTSLSQALDRVASEFPGILSAAFQQMQAERGLGQWNEDALANLVQRLGHKDVATLADALARAGRFGSRTADVLRDLAASVRAQRQERMRERSNRAGAAIVLPVAVFILPAIILVIGYPAMTMVTAALGGR